MKYVVIWTGRLIETVNRCVELFWNMQIAGDLKFCPFSADVLQNLTMTMTWFVASQSRDRLGTVVASKYPVP